MAIISQIRYARSDKIYGGPKREYALNKFTLDGERTSMRSPNAVHQSYWDALKGYGSLRAIEAGETLQLLLYGTEEWKVELILSQGFDDPLTQRHLFGPHVWDREIHP